MAEGFRSGSQWMRHRDLGWIFGAQGSRSSIITIYVTEHPLPSPHLLKMQGEAWEGGRKLASNLPKRASPPPYWGLQVRFLFPTPDSYKAMIPEWLNKDKDPRTEEPCSCPQLS